MLLSGPIYNNVGQLLRILLIMHQRLVELGKSKNERLTRKLHTSSAVPCQGSGQNGGGLVACYSLFGNNAASLQTTI